MSRAVLITGCSTGIGRAVMEHLTVSGHAVVATARRAASLTGFAASSVLVLDVSDSAATDLAVAAIPRRHGRIDVLLNDAGCAVRGVVEEVPGAAVEAMVDVNGFGVSRMVRPGRCCLRQRCGRGCPTGRVAIISACRGGLRGHCAVSRSG